VFLGIPLATLVYGALCLERYLSRVTIAILLGDASYCIYLFHIPAVQFFPASWPVKFVAAVAIGVAAHYLIDNPIQRARTPAKAALASFLNNHVHFSSSYRRPSRLGITLRRNFDGGPT